MEGELSYEEYMSLQDEAIGRLQDAEARMSESGWEDESDDFEPACDLDTFDDGVWSEKEEAADELPF